MNWHSRSFLGNFWYHKLQKEYSHISSFSYLSKGNSRSLLMQHHQDSHLQIAFIVFFFFWQVYLYERSKLGWWHHPSSHHCILHVNLDDATPANNDFQSIPIPTEHTHTKKNRLQQQEEREWRLWIWPLNLFKEGRKQIQRAIYRKIRQRVVQYNHHQCIKYEEDVLCLSNSICALVGKENLKRKMRILNGVVNFHQFNATRKRWRGT